MGDTTNKYDVIIIGAGPAGLAAGLYTARDRLKTLLLEKFMPGGQIINTDRIENYPGIEKVDGPGLIMSMQKQVESFGAEIANGKEVAGLRKLENGDIEVSCDDETYVGRVVILSPGSSYRKLGVPGEDEFRNAGAGVSYCGTCDAPFFRDKEVIAIGGGNTAVEEALHIAKYVKKVTLVHRRDEFRATKVLSEELFNKVNESNSNMAVRFDTVCTAIEGEGKVQSAKLKNVKTGEEEDVACDGVFIFIGMVPNTDFLQDAVELTEHGFIAADCAYLRTSVPGVFVAGDCRVGAAMQLATAVGDGVIAAMMLKNYLRDSNWWDEVVSDKDQPAGW